MLAMSGLAMAVATSVALTTTSAHAATLNHVYIRYHGLPTCTITFEWYDYHEKSVKKAHGTASPCKGDAVWNPDTVGTLRVHINSGTADYSKKYFSTNGPGHDHCILVKAFGDIVFTGDETQGCNSK